MTKARFDRTVTTLSEVEALRAELEEVKGELAKYKAIGGELCEEGTTDRLMKALAASQQEVEQIKTGLAYRFFAEADREINRLQQRVKDLTNHARNVECAAADAFASAEERRKENNELREALRAVRTELEAVYRDGRNADYYNAMVVQILKQARAVLQEPGKEQRG
jgi:chromosome segregation ATPase